MNETVTDEMVAAAWSAAREEISAPYMARVSDYVSGTTATPDELAALKAADAEADRLNDEFMRRVIQAALDARSAQ